MSIVFDRAAHYYDETRGFPPGIEKTVGAMFARLGGLTNKSRVFEVGIGTGRIALPVAPYVYSYVGIDLSRQMLTRLHSKRSNEPIYAIEGDATRLPLPSKAFDAVLAVHIFHLIPDYMQAMAELARILRPGGLLLHGGGGGQSETRDPFRALWDAWENAAPQTRKTVGVSREDRFGFVEELGWQPVAAEVFNYPVIHTARKFLDQFERRLWSSLWNLDDTAFSVGIKALREAIAIHFPDLDAPVELEARFDLHVHRAPSQ